MAQRRFMSSGVLVPLIAFGLFAALFGPLTYQFYSIDDDPGYYEETDRAGSGSSTSAYAAPTLTWESATCTNVPTTVSRFWQKDGPHSSSSSLLPKVAPTLDESGSSATWKVYPPNDKVASGTYQAQRGKKCISGQLRVSDRASGASIVVANYPRGYRLRWFTLNFRAAR